MRFLLLLSLLGVVGTSTAYAAEKPNVLIIMADDCTHTDLPLYGGQNAKTPNLDALAAQSLTFNKAYVSSAMCQPCRAELFTGKYPMQNGCAWNHSASRPDVTSMPHHMQKLGYRVGIAARFTSNRIQFSRSKAFLDSIPVAFENQRKHTTWRVSRNS